MKPKVALGFIGSKLDAGTGRDRWDAWRPTIALCQHEDLLFHRLELFFDPRFRRLAQQVSEDLHSVSPETELRLHDMPLKDPWDFEEVFEALHGFASRTPFDPEAEDYYIHITTGSHVAQICLFLLTESRHFPGKLIQTSPPSSRPGSNRDTAGSYTIIDLDLSRYDRIAERFRKQAADDVSFLKEGIETRNVAFNRLMERIERVVLHSPDPILLTGPTGAGKTRLARRIYDLKKLRRLIHGAFVEVNCATLQGDAAMSALFGHKKGAFTGASGDREGLLRAADKGLLFLDEVGELGLDEQAMLLRAIEEKRFRPLGSDREVESSFQLLCGTNRDLQVRVKEGQFREDLLARLDLWSFRLPGLVERPEDLEPNLDFELDRFAQRTGQRVGMNQEARRRFLAFALSSQAHWSANFRDLAGAVTRMATLAEGGRIKVEGVDEEIGRLLERWRKPDSEDRDSLVEEILGNRPLDRFDRVQLAEVIRVCRSSSNLSAAGRVLFSVSREDKRTPNDADRLRKYLAKFDLEWKDLKATE